LKERNNLYDDVTLIALGNVIYDTDEYFQRKIRRYVSERFHMSLREVQEMDFLDVLREYYESKMGDMDEEELYDLALKLVRPEILEERANKEDAYTQEAEKEEQERIKKGESLLSHIKKQKKQSSKKKKAPPPQPEAEPVFEEPEIKKDYSDFKDTFTNAELASMDDNVLEDLVNPKDK